MEEPEKRCSNMTVRWGEGRSVFWATVFCLLMQFYEARTRVTGRGWQISKINEGRFLFCTGHHQQWHSLSLQVRVSDAVVGVKRSWTFLDQQ